MGAMITLRYATGTAVKELTLTMMPGEVFCLLGENGAGKTTTMKCLSGQTGLSYGEAYVRGIDVRSKTIEVQRMLGVCPQHDVLFEGLSGTTHHGGRAVCMEPPFQNSVA